MWTAASNREESQSKEMQQVGLRDPIHKYSNKYQSPEPTITSSYPLCYQQKQQGKGETVNSCQREKDSKTFLCVCTKKVQKSCKSNLPRNDAGPLDKPSPLVLNRPSAPHGSLLPPPARDWLWRSHSHRPRELTVSQATVLNKGCSW